MINTRLVIALEELFKKEPFDLENITFNITASYGRITIDPNADEVQSLKEEIGGLETDKDSAEMSLELAERDVEDLETKISDLKELLDENDIDY